MTLALRGHVRAECFEFERNLRKTLAGHCLQLLYIVGWNTCREFARCLLARPELFWFYNVNHYSVTAGSLIGFP